MKKLLSAALAVIVLLAVVGSAEASKKSTAVPPIRHDNPGYIELGLGGGVYEYNIYNLGVVSSISALGMVNRIPLQAASDTVRLGTVKKTYVLPSKATDSLMVGTGLIARNIQCQTIAGTDSNIDAGYIRMAGRDAVGAKVTEIFTLTNNTEFKRQGTVCFAYLDSLTVPAAAADGDVAIYIGRGQQIGLPWTGEVQAPVLAVWENGAWKTLGATVTTPVVIDIDSCYASSTAISGNSINLRGQTTAKGSYDYKFIFWLSRYQSVSAATKW